MCSQAIYKNSYDWVKVDPENVESENESRVSVIKAIAANRIAAITDSVQAVVAAVNDSIRNEKADCNDEHVKSTRLVNNTMVEQEIDDDNMKANTNTTVTKMDSGDKRSSKQSRTFDNVDWGSVAFYSVIIIVVGLLWYFKSNPVVQVIILVLELLFAIGSLVAICIAIWWICKVFVDFVTMMG